MFANRISLRRIVRILSAGGLPFVLDASLSGSSAFHEFSLSFSMSFLRASRELLMSLLWKRISASLCEKLLQTFAIRTIQIREDYLNAF